MDSVTCGFPVALARCSGYGRESITAAVCKVLDAAGWKICAGDAVLVKPNLLRAVPLACTHPEVVRAACLWLLDHEARVTVADSPGFGTAGGVAEAIGLSAALESLGLVVHGPGAAGSISLPDGRKWRVSRLALESDAILSIPRIKAHSQVRLSLSVKNLFGCVCGVRKALAHTVQGEDLVRFTDCVAAMWAALPPVAGLADGVTAMHVTGPAGGQPFPLACIGAAADAVALDTAIYELLHVTPDRIPVWAALLRRKIPAADPAALVYPLLVPSDFVVDGLVLPEVLRDISFRPGRLIWSMCRRFWLDLRQ